MEYDPLETYRVDEGELELTEEAAAAIAEQQQQQQLEQISQETELEPPSTEVQQQQPQDLQPQVSTEPFDPQRDYSYYEARGMSRGEWNKLQMSGGVDADLGALADDPMTALEFATSVPTGGLDFGVEILNAALETKIPKLPTYENNIAQGIRNIASVVLPTYVGAGALKAATAGAKLRTGWSIGNTPFFRWLGNRSAETASSLIVGGISSEYTEDNLLGMAKKALPPQYDFIPDSLATLDTDTPEDKRRKNIFQDLGLGVVTEMAVGLTRMGAAMVGETLQQREINKLIGNTAASRRWLKDAEPPKADTIEESIELGLLKQEEALDEIGEYGRYLNPRMDKPIKGIHDIFDYSEIGTRTVDNYGIVGASVDQSRIARNLDTVDGRIGNFISEPAIKYSLSSEGNIDDVILGLSKQLNDAGDISAAGKGWKISLNDQIDDTLNITQQLFDPRMSRDDILRIVSPLTFVNDSGKQVLTEEGFGVIAKTLRNFGEEITSMDYTRAHSLLAGSLSGRVSDLSEGIRLMDGSDSVITAKQKIVDLMKFLVQLDGSASYYKMRKVNLIDQVRNGFKNIAGYNEATVEGADAVGKEIFQKAERFGTTLESIAEAKPQLMDQFLLAYEMSDGKISTIRELNDYVFDKTINLGKAILDFNPELDNKLLSGIWGNLYASYLSAFKTPIQAFTGGVGGIISKPTTHFIGALANWDFKALKRNYLAYGSMQDSLRRSFPYMGSIFAKASRNVDEVSSITRRDLLLKQEADMELLKEIAKSREAEGSWGLSYIVQQIEMLNALAKDPVTRFGSNGLIATDGFSGAMIAHSEAYFRAMDEIVDSGKPITKETVGPIAQKHYKRMFDERGLIKDEAVKWTNNELALNLDSPLVENLNGFSDHVTFMKPFLMFPTTGANVVSMFGKYAPFKTFQRDYNELTFTPLKQLLGNEEYIDHLLTSRGVDISSMSSLAKANRITDLKYEAQGRKFIGLAAVAGVFAFMQDDRITGDGHFDKETQASRVKQGNWKPRSIKGLDGKYYSYKALGPIADWIATTVNVFDNFDSLGSTGIENFAPKLAFVLSASITDNTGLSTVRPLFDMLSGNEGARNRWAAGMFNGLGPLAGQRGEWSRIFSDGLRMVDNDLLSYIGNRNRFAEGILGTTAAPFVYSPISGKKVNSYGFMQRLWNAYSPIAIHAESSPEEEFINAIEYDLTTTFKTKEGVKVPIATQSELFRIMGEQGFFKRGIQEVMRSNEEWKSMESFEKMKAEGKTVRLKEWHNIHNRLRKAQRYAEQMAYMALDSQLKQNIITSKIEDQETDRASRLGVDVDQLLNIRR